jgi:hypothetical protein
LAVYSSWRAVDLSCATGVGKKAKVETGMKNKLNLERLSALSSWAGAVMLLAGLCLLARLLYRQFGR